MVVGGKYNYVHVKRRSRPYYSKRCKEKKSLTTIECLPDELVFNILLQLSIEDIYNGPMLVSRKWYNMIRSHDFIHAHLQHSTLGLLVQSFDFGKKLPSFVAIRQGRIDVSKLSYGIRPQHMWDSCNGLILEYDFWKPPLSIINPAIKQMFEIPPFSRGKAEHRCSSIAYSAASKEYKVIHTYELIKDPNLQCAIVTIGVDRSWRDVCTKHLSPASKNLLGGKLIMTEGFIHCTGNFNDDHVLTLNVESETITQNPIPHDLKLKWRCYLSTGKSLSVFVECGKLCCDGWEMKSETGEWTKMYTIDLNAHKRKLEELCGKMGSVSTILPVGWLKYQEVLVLRFFRQTRVCIAYNVRTHEIDSFELDSDSYTDIFQVHTNSLVWLKPPCAST